MAKQLLLLLSKRHNRAANHCAYDTSNINTDLSIKAQENEDPDAPQINLALLWGTKEGGGTHVHRFQNLKKTN